MNQRILEHRFGRLWTECQNCAGQVLDEIMCSAYATLLDFLLNILF
jgi:hypothetical protein